MSKKIPTEPEQALLDANPKLKISMVAALLFVTTHGRMSADNLALFTTDFCEGAGATTSNGPREVTILKDIEGVQLGRKCTVTGLWFPTDRFAKNTTCVKAADAAKGKLYNTSKVMEKDAQTILGEAKDIVDVNEKVAKYEEYDAKLAEAKAHRLQAVEITDEMSEGGLESIEALAEALSVEVNPVKPVEPAEDTDEDTEEA